MCVCELRRPKINKQWWRRRRVQLMRQGREFPASGAASSSKQRRQTERFGESLRIRQDIPIKPPHTVGALDDPFPSHLGMERVRYFSRYCAAQ